MGGGGYNMVRDGYNMGGGSSNMRVAIIWVGWL